MTPPEEYIRKAAIDFINQDGVPHYKGYNVEDGCVSVTRSFKADNGETYIVKYNTEKEEFSVIYRQETQELEGVTPTETKDRDWETHPSSTLYPL